MNNDSFFTPWCTSWRVRCSSPLTPTPAAAILAAWTKPTTPYSTPRRAWSATWTPGSGQSRTHRGQPAGRATAPGAGPHGQLRRGSAGVGPEELLLVSFSNCWFEPKVIRLWRGSSEGERAILVESWLRQAGRFGQARVHVCKVPPRPADDKYAAHGLPSDPVWAVYAERLGGESGRPAASGSAPGPSGGAGAGGVGPAPGPGGQYPGLPPLRPQAPALAGAPDALYRVRQLS